MPEITSYVLETHTDFSYVFERTGRLSRLFGRHFRYVCYLYERETLKAKKIERGFTKTRDEALKKINDIVLEWRETQNKGDN